MAAALAAPPAWAPTGCAIRPPLAHRRAVLAGRSHAVSRTAAAAASPLAGRHGPHATPSWGATRRRSSSGRSGPAPLRQTGGGVLEAAEAGSPGSGGHSTRWFERSADALLDDLGAADTITSLLHTCMTERGIDDADNSHPFTVFLIFHVPTNRTLQFETWVQKTISLQAQRFPGYRGTLIYRPDSNIKVGTNLSGPGDTVSYLLDIRYRGAANLSAWVNSHERDVLYTQANRQGLWVPEATHLRVVDGNNGSVDSLWQDDRTVKAHKETSFAKWRVVFFKSLCVWVAVMACNWPGCSLGSALKTLGFTKLQTHTITVTIAVAVVVYVCVPFFQPFVSSLLVSRTKEHPDMSGGQAMEDDQPLLTLTETLEEHRDAATKDAASLLRAVEDDSLGLIPDTDGMVTVVLHHHVKPGRFEAFEDACRDLADAAEAFDADGFVGHTIVRPPPESNVFTLIFRYQNRDALELWLGSEEQERFAARLYKLVQSPAEVQVANYSAVDLLLSGYDNNAAERKAPPPKWKAFLLITFSLYFWSLVSIYVWAPNLAALGVPYPLIVLATSFWNCGTHSYSTTPLLSRLLANWLQAPSPAPSWMSKDNPLYRWATQGFTQPELRCLVASYFAWVMGRYRPPILQAA
mmetsp:Transcript_10665/g.27104  ORF Transcript_10665/g.27104 Transcript_10665/m.27104 type:complete len:635 (+) Transcript_10665:256-2160(+)